MGSSGEAVSVTEPVGSLHQLTSKQRANRPETQRKVVKQFHPNEGAKPRGRGSLEELVVVGIDIELAHLRDKIGLEKRREQGEGIHWKCFSGQNQ